MSWHTFQRQDSSQLPKLRPCFFYGENALGNTWIICISVQNADRANSRLPTRSRRENDVTITQDVSKSKVWKCAVPTNDKKKAAGIQISETRKKTWTKDYCIDIHTNITQLYTKTYCWQHNTVLYENINWRSVCHKINYRTSWHFEHKILCVIGGGQVNCNRDSLLKQVSCKCCTINSDYKTNLRQNFAAPVLAFLTTGYFIRTNIEIIYNVAVTYFLLWFSLRSKQFALTWAPG